MGKIIATYTAVLANIILKDIRGINYVEILVTLLKISKWVDAAIPTSTTQRRKSGDAFWRCEMGEQP